MRRILRIYVHTSASATLLGKVLYPSVEEIRSWHIKQGWSDVGYHYVVNRDGGVSRGRPESEPGAGVKGDNAHSLHVCVSGHGDRADFTPEQKAGLVNLICKLLKRHGIVDRFRQNPMTVLGHREVNDLIRSGVVSKRFGTSKSCPGRKVDTRALRILVSRALGEQT